VPDLGGQVVVVFGASSGIGRATALAFAAEGASVVAAARRGALVEELAREIEGTGGRALAMEADVVDRSTVDAVIAQTVEQLRRVDVMVNAAGVNIKQRRMDELTEQSWNGLLATNLTGAFNTTQAALVPMRAQRGGVIIQIGSVSGRYGDMSGAAYQASKHGVVGLMYATMAEERHNGIRATAIMPGLVDTPLLRGRPVPPKQEVLDQSLQPEDIAQGCIFLAGLPPRNYVPELIMLPATLQMVGNTIVT
jgi:NAD(P)-dependent dehydrogenase (short-subunit alcohol dehydrogenase family)